MSFQLSNSSSDDADLSSERIVNSAFNSNSKLNNKSGNISLSPKSKSKAMFQNHHHHHHHHHLHHHQIHPKTRSKSFNHTSASSSPSPQLQQTAQPAQQERRASSFSSTSSPWFRRKSFLSSSMMSNDKSSIYELSSYSYDQRVPTFTMSLKESQGFIFNQDLFASQYQQSRVVLQDDNQGVIIKDMRNERSVFDNREENENYGIETTDVFIETDESDSEDAVMV